MSLNIDSTRALRRQSELVSLVRAIVDAGEHDESTSVEWKSDLDLETKKGHFSVARAILGLANRDPARAAATFEGYGYIVIGASPHSLVGVTTVDSARAATGINEYVGDQRGPAWALRYIDVDDVKVAVVEVDPPKAGDPIWPLRKEFTDTDTAADRRRPGGLQGAVFVRKPARTQLATDADIDMLSARAAAGSTDARPQVDVSIAGDVPISWFSEHDVAAAAQRWVDTLADTMIEEAEESLRPAKLSDGQHKSYLGADAAAMFAAAQRLTSSLQAAGFASSTSDPRSLEDYRAEVDRWQRRALSYVTEHFLDFYSGQGHGAVHVAVRNNSLRFLTDVKVTITFPWHRAHAVDALRDPGPPPHLPRKFGEPPPKVPSELSALFERYSVPMFDVGPDVGRRVWVEGGSIKITFDVGQLRPQETEIGDTIWTRLPARPDNGMLEGTWRLTAAGLHDVLEGPISVPVAEHSTDPEMVLDAELSRER